MAKELAEVNEFEVFKVLANGGLAPPGYKRIPYSIVFDVKFDLRRKAMIVVGGLRTDSLGNSCYSGVVLIDTVRLALFFSVLNSLQFCAAYCGNAFIHGKTHEKYYNVAGTEFS